jgi:CRISPR/Cas system-associated exonuclease Cas4 (RecB family)
MALPSDFQFSQSSLQDYVDCPRRFYLRYVRRLSWPAIVAEPALEHERHLQQGIDFHQLVYQHELGISAERLSAVITDANLRRWWVNYLEKGPGDIPQAHYPEILLSAPVGGHRLVAKYDLLAVEPGSQAVILDWKTYRQRRGANWLSDRLQTRVYPYLLVRGGAHLNDNRALEPGQVEMVYWFANFPDRPEVFEYGLERYREDEVYLSSLIEEIENLAEEEFQLTADKKRCDFCPYRSLCQRGVLAGDLGQAMEDWEAEMELDISLDFDQIAEIEY